MDCHGMKPRRTNLPLGYLTAADTQGITGRVQRQQQLDGIPDPAPVLERRGGRRGPLPPHLRPQADRKVRTYMDDERHLKHLVSTGYAPNMNAAIRRAIAEAASRWPTDTEGAVD